MYIWNIVSVTADYFSLFYLCIIQVLHVIETEMLAKKEMDLLEKEG